LPGKARSLSLERARADIEWVAGLASVTMERASNYSAEAAEDSAFHSQLLDTLKTGGRTNYVQIATPLRTLRAD
jgi:hypothetical protein